MVLVTMEWRIGSVSRAFVLLLSLLFPLTSVAQTSPPLSEDPTVLRQDLTRPEAMMQGELRTR